MQYGLDIRTYDRRKNYKAEVKIHNEPIKIVLSIIIGIMISRVVLVVTNGIVIAPFGLAYLIAILENTDRKYRFFNLVSIFIGYLTIVKIAQNGNLYLIACITIYITSYCTDIFNIQRKKELYFIVLLSTVLVSGLGLNEYSIWGNILFSMSQLFIVIPMYHIIKNALKCLEEIKTNYFFSTEELISISILICLVITGIGNVELWGINLRNIMALGSVIMIGFVSGAGIGAALGVAMGLIMGISNGDTLILISTFSLCGLIVGIFKDSGKIMAMIAYLISWMMITVYSGEMTLTVSIEAVIAGMMLLVIPSSFIDIAIKEINSTKKVDLINEKNLNGIKKEFSTRLEDLKKVLINLSSSIGGLSENDNLMVKSKGTALVETLADRVCSDCELNRKCWERDLNNTFCSFSDLIRSSENKALLFPEYLEKRCVKKEGLIRNTQELVNMNIINETLKERLEVGRNIIANHISNMASAMGDIIKDFNKDVGVCVEIDRLLRKTLNRKGVKYKDVFCYTDRRGRLKIELGLRNCEGANYCANEVLPIIKDLVNLPLCFTSDGCKINPNNNSCAITIQETPKYHVVSHVSSLPKDGEKLSGDSYSFSKNDDGRYITMISDGMGSGPGAGNESKVAIDLIENFLDAGFDDTTAINSVNSVIGMKFSEDEKFTTLDLNSIDLYTGGIEFIKVGGASSFIKRGNKVEVIKTHSLPFGVVDRVEIDVIKNKVTHGDMIVTISDGILDIDKSNIGSNIWIKEYLENVKLNPEDLAKGILEKAKKLCDGKVEDDMTVIVSKLYAVY